MADQAIINTHSDYISKVLHTCQRHKGVPDTFSGDRVLLTYNGIRPCATHPEMAAQTGLELSRACVVNQAVKLSMSVVSGGVRAGHIGAVKMRRYCMIGPVVPWAFALERYCRMEGYTLLVNFRIVQSCRERVRFKHAGAIKFPKMGPKLQLVSRAIEPEPGTEDEWTFLDPATDPMNRWNELVVLLASERWDAASEYLLAHREEVAASAHTPAEHALLKSAEDRTFTPPEMRYY
eukprot:TRINITY_DN1354_c0_g3_i2.p1 TRINITY_DN1354_c0_g3~~TRINITY_DN1354_c0_g3_i2.p1  ORF type:complete len:274 (+),score=88.28 TRINITY_DN1354_c0_g3_i2:119-823(+)